MRLYKERGVASRNNVVTQWNAKPIGHSGCELRLAVALLGAHSTVRGDVVLMNTDRTVRRGPMPVGIDDLLSI
jgi:hypothetical protein